MSDIYISGVATSKPVPRFQGNEVELVHPVIRDAIDDAGITPADIEFSTASSSDSYAGQAFAFVRMLDASGAYPTIEDSHLDMDGAWALYEAWVRLQVGDINTALVYALGRSSSGSIEDISAHTLDPYYLAPLNLNAHATAALQTSRLLHEGTTTAERLTSLKQQARQNAEAHGHTEILEQTPGTEDSTGVPRPLTHEHLPIPADAAAAVVLTTYPTNSRSIRIRNIQHRTDAHSLGVRPLTFAPSFETALGALNPAPPNTDDIDVIELHTRYPHELVLLAKALNTTPESCLSPDGGTMTANPVMASGLIRHIEATRRLRAARSGTAVAHATSGPALQQNLISILEVPA